MPIARVALPVAADTAFDYWAPEALGIARGSVVRVHLGPRKLAGVVVEVVAASDVAPEKLQTIDALAAIPPLHADVLDMASFVAAYYQEPLGMAAALAVPPLSAGRVARRAAEGAWMLTALGRQTLLPDLPRSPSARALLEQLAAAPAGLPATTVVALPAYARRILRVWRERHFVEAATPSLPVPDAPVVALNADQRAAAAAIGEARGAFAPFVLFGVTGSGKTDVYLAAAAQMIAAGGQVLLLVPEINLTPQLERRVRAALSGVTLALLHSGLADGERREHWQAAAAGEAKLVLGTRLAVFAPMPSLSLIVVDEEHDGSYKQQDNVRYHARDVAVWRAHRRNVPGGAGSATPSPNRGCTRSKGATGGSTCRGARRSAGAHAAGAVRGQPAGARRTASARRCALRWQRGWHAASSRWCSSIAAGSAVAALRRLRVGSGLPSLQRQAHNASHAGGIALSSLRARGGPA